MKLRLALGILLLIFLAGRFLPGPGAWGFNHLAYLPGVFLPVWLLLAAAVMWPSVQARLTRLLVHTLPAFLFESRAGRWILPLLCGLLFALLRERSFFMGDGYLVGELVDRGVAFRAFDSLDYLLHIQIYHALRNSGSSISSFDVYRIGSVLAGVLAAGLLPVLVRRLDWEPWRKAAFLGLFLFQGAIVFFFGYVESYSFLFVFLSAFMISGLLVLQGRGSLWVASTFFGLALAFHLTALFTGPALLYLALRAPVRPGGRRWLEAAVPTAALFALAVALHLAEGYNAFWFRREFIESKNAQSIWIPLFDERGILTSYHWKDLLNLVLITAPVCLIAVFSQWRRIRSRALRPDVAFLLVQIGVIGGLSLVIDRKLGGARDWDLLAAHTSGLVLLAAMFLPAAQAGADAAGPGAPGKRTRALSAPSPVVGALLAVAGLLVVPWIVLLHIEQRSIDRFVDVASDFPRFARAYAYEEVGKYYRKAEDMDRAVEMYERCVESYPGNPRFRILLGSVYFMRGDVAKAKGEYEAALEKDPASFMAMEMLGKVALQQRDFPTAVQWFQKLVQQRPANAQGWQMLGYSAARAGMPQEAVRGYAQAMVVDPSLNEYHDLGVGLLQLRRYEDAVRAFRQAISRGQTRGSTRLGLAWSLTEAAAEEVRSGRRPPEAWLAEAEGLLKNLVTSDSTRIEAEDLRRRLNILRGM